MADIFRSAFSYISQTGKADNNFVGQYVELGPIQLRVKKVLAEGNRDVKIDRNAKRMMFSVHFVVVIGGYGFVFVAQDENTGKDYALKVS